MILCVIIYGARCHQAIWQSATTQVNYVMQVGNVCWLSPPSRCLIFSQVSRAWRVLAEDAVLWFRMCIGEGYHQDASVSDSPCWKSTLRDCRNSAKTLRSNWKVGFNMLWWIISSLLGSEFNTTLKSFFYCWCRHQCRLYALHYFSNMFAILWKLCYDGPLASSLSFCLEPSGLHQPAAVWAGEGAVWRQLMWQFRFGWVSFREPEHAVWRLFIASPSPFLFPLSLGPIVRN